MKNYHSLPALFLSLLVSAAQASSIGLPPWTDCSFVGTISIGPTTSGDGRRQSFFLTPQIEKTYTAGNAVNPFINAEIFLGVQKCLCSSFAGQLGVAFVYSGDAKLSGHIWDDADPQFYNHLYEYRINHTHVALKGSILTDVGYCLRPWLSFGIGIGFNNTSFSNRPIIFEAMPNANFSSETRTTFVYTVGAGVQRLLTKHWQIGIGYEFASWGKSELGRAPGQTLNNGLSLSALHTNGVLFNITYLS